MMPCHYYHADDSKDRCMGGDADSTVEITGVFGKNEGGTFCICADCVYHHLEMLTDSGAKGANVYHPRSNIFAWLELKNRED